jgi:hypothetical protein
MVLSLWDDCPNAYVAEIVTDEDSTTRSKSSHPNLELLAAGRMTCKMAKLQPKSGSAVTILKTQIPQWY